MTAEQVAEQVAEKVRGPAIWLARMGYAARGIVYSAVGFLALRAALHSGGKVTDSEGALAEIGRQPMGFLLLAVLTLGIFGFVIWRWYQAFADPDRDGNSALGLAKRAMYFLGGTLYISLGVGTVKMLVPGRRAARGDSTRSWSAWLLHQPLGQALLVGVALGLWGFAVQQVICAGMKLFARKLELERLKPAHQTWVLRVAAYGIAARAVVFFLIGLFIFRAAVKGSPNEAKGFGPALRALSQQPAGDFLLMVVATGLVAFALYQLFESRYRRVPR